MSATRQDADDSDEPETAVEKPDPDPDEYVDGQEEDSFPASDPHSDWSGPPERD